MNGNQDLLDSMPTVDSEQTPEAAAFVELMRALCGRLPGVILDPQFRRQNPFVRPPDDENDLLDSKLGFTGLIDFMTALVAIGTASEVGSNGRDVWRLDVPPVGIIEWHLPHRGGIAIEYGGFAMLHIGHAIRDDEELGPLTPLWFRGGSDQHRAAVEAVLNCPGRRMTVVS